MAISSILPTIATTTATKHASHRRRHHQQKQQQQYEEEEEQRRRGKKKKKQQPPSPTPPPPPKPPSSWEQFKNLLTCRSIVPSQVHNPSSPAPTAYGKQGSSCSGICAIKDVVHTNSRVVHRGDNEHSPDSSGHLGQETRLLAARSSAGRSAVRHYQSSRGMQLSKFTGCYECHAISESTRYPMPRLISSCPECGEVFTKSESLELHQMVRHAVSELGPEDSGRNIVEIIFKSSWVKKVDIMDHLNNPPPIFFKIDRILKVHNTQRTISRFEDYRDAVKSRAALHLLHNNTTSNNNITSTTTNRSGKKNPRCAADGNELLRFHCTTLSCSLGAHGSTSLCCGHSSSSNSTLSTTPPCGVCSIIRHGFGRAKQEPGKGVRTTASSGTAHECLGGGTGGFNSAAEEGGGRRRAMLVCRVIAGRVRKTGDMEEDMVGVGYDSVAGGKQGYHGGGYGNLEELFVTNPRAILPCFVVIYRTLE